MFQSYKATSNPANGAPRVAKLRYILEKHQLDGFLVPRADAHQGEYVAARDQRLAWLTGFTGSAGMALILKDKAILFVDGRYTIQVRQQTDPEIFTYVDLIATPPHLYLQEQTKGLKIAFDPWLHTINQTKALRHALAKTGGELISVDANPVDAIWDDQPPAPLGRVSIQPLDYAGQPAKDKLLHMQQTIQKAQAAATVLTDPSSIAWLFNIRGADVSNTPLPLSFAIVPADMPPTLFIDERKLGPDEMGYLQDLCTLAGPDLLQSTLQEMAKMPSPIMLDPDLAAEQLRMIIMEAGGAVTEGKDPARLPRAIKNSAELAGARAAHIRDGVAMVHFLSWLDEQTVGSVTEISAAQKLEQTRSEIAEQMGSKLEDLSFDSISSTGPNAAMNHYRVTEETNRTLQDGELYLIDSGGQYRDGTTDITRTVPVGTINPDYKRSFTLVLKGMIAISTALFPEGTRGQDIDAFARRPLWQHGFDFAHGTGHGVGSFLAVHEGPQRLARTGSEPLRAGMIVSNEPGYYKANEYGIRIENLIVVNKAEIPENGDLPMHTFETITFCPIDTRLVDLNLLTDCELNWLNNYHTDVRDKLSTHVTGAQKDWLFAATEHLKR